MGEFDTTCCIVCGRAFTLRTGATFWVIDARGELLGVAHLQCQRRRGSGLLRLWTAAAPLDGMRFLAWHFAHVPPPRHGAALYAGMLMDGLPPSDTPTAYQTRLLDHWSRPESAIGADMAVAAWRRYLELAAAYRAHEAARAHKTQGDIG